MALGPRRHGCPNTPAALCNQGSAVGSTARQRSTLAGWCQLRSLAGAPVAAQRLSTAGWPQSGHHAGRLRSRARFEKRVICPPSFFFFSFLFLRLALGAQRASTLLPSESVLCQPGGHRYQAVLGNTCVSFAARYGDGHAFLCTLPRLSWPHPPVAGL